MGSDAVVPLSGMDRTDGMSERSGAQGASPQPTTPPIHRVKRRTADRRDWALIARHRYAAVRVDEAGFAGHVTLLCIDAVTEPFPEQRSGLRLADAGFAWMTHFPDGAHHAVTTMFDAAGGVIQWYVDICRAHGLGADGVPWWDDLYLDIVVYPAGETLLLDDDELELALAHGYVTRAEYDLAWGEARRLLAGTEGALSPARLAGRSTAHRALLHPH